MRARWRWAFLALLATACDGALTDPRVPPFRERPYGPGLELGSSGRKHEFWSRSELLGKVRVSERGIRVYDGDALRIGRLAVASDGWTLSRADGSTLCTVVDDAEAHRFQCDWGTLAIHGTPDRVVIDVDGEEWVRIVAGEGYRTEAPGDPEAYGRWSDGAALAIQTHPDAWSHTDIRPALDPRIALAWSMSLPGEREDDVRLLGAAVGFLASLERSPVESTSGDEPAIEVQSAEPSGSDG